MLKHVHPSPYYHQTLPNIHQYIQKVHNFYNLHQQQISNRIQKFISLAIQLSNIPTKLAQQFNEIKQLPQVTQEQKIIQRLMVKNQIHQFVQLRSKVIQASVGQKFLYPELPKVRRKFHERKRKHLGQNQPISQSSTQEDRNCSNQEVQINETTATSQQIDQISSLFQQLKLEPQNTEQLCESIQSIVQEMNKLNIEENKNQIKYDSERQRQRKSSIELQHMRQTKKVELFRFQNRYCEKMIQNEDFIKNYMQKLQQLKQLFTSHLKKSVQSVLSLIKHILTKGFRDISHSRILLLPLHKISSQFHLLNKKFYQTQSLLKTLQKYLQAKTYQCYTNQYQMYKYQDKEISIRSNFRLRFFKHLLVEGLFGKWLIGAVKDLQREQIKTLQQGDLPQPMIHEDIQDKQGKQNLQDHDQTEMDSHPNRKDSHSYQHFIS